MSTELMPAPSEFTTANLIFKFLEASLSTVPFHRDSPAITRLIADRFPMHLAIHEVRTVTQSPEPYTLPHVHDDEDEINIILSTGYLKYSIMLADEYHTVTANSSIYIPRGMLHSANVIGGFGFFITLRF